MLFDFRKLVYTAVACICLSVSSGALADTLTLDKALATALQHNPQLKAAEARLGISDAQIRTAGARLNPALISDNGVAEKTYRLGIEQTVELGGKRKNRMEVAKAQRRVVQAEINTQLLELRATVRRFYTQLYNAIEKEKAYQEIVHTTAQLLDVAKKREQAGDIARVDVLSARIAFTSARNDWQTAAYQVIEARNRLGGVLGHFIPEHTSLALPPTPEYLKALSEKGAAPDPETLVRQALTNRPEVQRLSQSLEVSQQQLKLAQSNRVPNLRLAVGPDWVTGSDSQFNAFVIGNVELPVFNRQQGPLQEARATQKQLLLEQAALQNRIAFEVASAQTAVVASRKRTLLYETELLPDTSQVVSMARLSFQEGKSSILTPVNAQQAYINIRLGYLQALLDYQNAISDLERSVGAGL